MQKCKLEASMKRFLENEEEQELLGLFHKALFVENDTFFLVDTRKKTTELLQVSSMSLLQRNQTLCTTFFRTSDSTFCFSIKEDAKSASYYISQIYEGYIHQSGEGLNSIEENNYEMVLVRQRHQFAQDDESREDLRLTFQSMEDDFQEPWLLGLNLSSNYLAFETTNLTHENLYFSTIYIKNKDYMLWQEAKMRKTLRKAYQQNPDLMKHLEERHPDLKEVSSSLLPHRFESVVGTPFMKVIK